MEDDDQDNDGSAAPESFFSFNPAQEAPTDSTAAEELRRKARESILAAEAVAAAAAAVGPSLPQESSSSGTGLPELKKKPFEEWELHRRPRPENEELENEDADEEMEPVFTEETFIPGPEVGGCLYFIMHDNEFITENFFILPAKTCAYGTRRCGSCLSGRYTRRLWRRQRS